MSDPLPLPAIGRVDGHPWLLVDGQPFLLLGLQWDFDSCFSAEEMNPLFPHAVDHDRMVLMLQIENEPGILGSAIAPIVEAQGTNRLCTCVQETGEGAPAGPPPLAMCSLTISTVMDRGAA
jgi:hypothetical protein